MKNKSGKIDLAELFGKPARQDERVYSKVAVNIHEFYLCGEIDSADEYIAWFDQIRHAGPNEVVKIYINSVGGDLFTAIQFMRVLNECEAPIVISIEGACMSAATMLLMYGDSYEISEHSMIMIHNYSGGTVGKGGEMLDQLQHERVWSEKLLRTVYKDFLTEVEIQSILDNKDIWMDGLEVQRRLEIMVSARDRDDEEIGEVEADPEPAPKKRKSKDVGE